jgi:hypothetical protein
MNNRLALATLALLTAVSFAHGDDPNFAGVEGHYERENPQNGWHYVVISTAPDRGPYAWVNREGKRWTVETGQSVGPESEGSIKRMYLSFGDDSVYPGHTFDIQRDKDGNVTALLEKDKDGNDRPKWVRKETPVVKGFEGITGHYESDYTKKNNWHYVVISTAPDRGPFAWVNRDGRRWTVETGESVGPESEGSIKKMYLAFGADSPYPGHTFDVQRDKDGNVTALVEKKKDGNVLQKWVRQK